MTRRTARDMLQPLDAAARLQAMMMLRTSRYGALATIAPNCGSPLASRVSVATAQTGDPIFLISQLSAHFGALEADSRCSLLIGEPGAGDPLAHPRMTLIGQAGKIDGDERTALRRRFLARHPKATLYADFGDFAFWRLDVKHASLICGFGKAHAVKRNDLCIPPIPELEAKESELVEHINKNHRDAIDRCAAEAGAKGNDWKLATLDPTGLDFVRGDDTARFSFDPPLADADQLYSRLVG